MKRFGLQDALYWLCWPVLVVSVTVAVWQLIER